MSDIRCNGCDGKGSLFIEGSTVREVCDICGGSGIISREIDEEFIENMVEAEYDRDRYRKALIKIQEITPTIHNHDRMTHKIINEVLNDE